MAHFEQTSEAIILVKAVPQFGSKHGETVCCAGITPEGEWVRLYPISFRTLDEAKQFRRWDRVRFRWRKPPEDHRPESRRVDHQSVEIVGNLKPAEHVRFLAPFEVSSVNAERAKGRTLALLRPHKLKFYIEERELAEIEEERERNQQFAAQADLFNAKKIVPYEPCPYRFKYSYETDDGMRDGTCQDWETDATFYNLQKRYGVKGALGHMEKVFGRDYPKKGMVFAMGTHSLYPDVWLINAVIRLDRSAQASMLI
jgi:hypothetical protein